MSMLTRLFLLLLAIGCFVAAVASPAIIGGSLFVCSSVFLSAAFIIEGLDRVVKNLNRQ